MISFLSGFVNAQTPAEKTPVGKFFDNVWSSWTAGEGIPPLVAKVLFWFVIVLLIYSISNMFPGLSGTETGITSLRWVLSIIVGFLGTAYLTPEFIFALITEYSAMGFALGAVLPLMALIFFSYSIVSNTNIGNLFVKRLVISLLWVAFGIYILFRIIEIGSLDVGVVSGTVSVAHWIILGIVFIFVVFSRRIIRLVMKGEMEALTENAKQAYSRAGESLRRLENLQQDMETTHKLKQKRN